MERPAKTLRMALGLDRVEWADSLGVGAPYVYQWEEGHEALGRQTALRMVETYREAMSELGITLEDLLRGERVQGNVG